MSKFQFKQNVLYLLIPLITVLLIIPGDLMAKSGAVLLIEKRDRQQVEGELISVDVKEKFLVLKVSGEAVKIHTDEVEFLRIQWKLYGKKAAFRGFLIGAAVGASIGLFSNFDPHGEALITRRRFTLYMIGIFGFLGAISTGTTGKYKKKIQVNGRSSAALTKILKKLKKKALLKK